MTTIFLRLALFLATLWLANAAGNMDQCPGYCQDTLENVYCIAPIIVEVRVLNETPFTAQAGMFPDDLLNIGADEMYRYEIDILDVYKAPLNSDLPRVIESNGSPALCGLRYKPGTTYVLMTAMVPSALGDLGAEWVFYGTNCQAKNIDVKAESTEYAAVMNIINRSRQCY